MSADMKGILFIISGPSGVGKGTVIRELKREFPQFEYPISHTTRDIRPGEKDGEVYHFITKEEFEDEIEKGNFLEWAMVHQDNYYGTLKKTIMDALEEGKIIVREVDVQGAQSMQKVLDPKNLVTIFIKAESEKKLLGRIAKRGELPKEEVERRMESARKEMKLADEFDHQVWNYEGKVEDCISDVKDIMGNEIEKADLKI